VERSSGCNSREEGAIHTAIQAENAGNTAPASVIMRTLGTMPTPPPEGNPNDTGAYDLRTPIARLPWRRGTSSVSGCPRKR
jgi:hypothetical protein